MLELLLELVTPLPVAAAVPLFASAFTLLIAAPAPASPPNPE